MRFVVFDPALRTTGVAVFVDGVLVDAYAVRVAGRGRGPSVWGEVSATVWASLPQGPVDLVAIEAQAVYPHAKADPNDLLQVAGVAGGLAALARQAGATVVHFDPAEWKGQVPKDVMAARAKAKLASVELAAIRPQSTLDTWDAIGIGLHYLKGAHRGPT